MASDQHPVITAIRELAAERPDFKYTDQEGSESDDGCSYIGSSWFDSSKGEGCIVGQALMRTGVKREDLKAVEDALSQALNVGQLHARNPELFGESQPTRDELRWMLDVQSQQDNERSWADAVTIADGILRNIRENHAFLQGAGHGK